MALIQKDQINSCSNNEHLKMYSLSSRYLFASRLMKIQKGNMKDTNNILHMYQSQKLDLMTDHPMNLLSSHLTAENEVNGEQQLNLMNDQIMGSSNHHINQIDHQIVNNVQNHPDMQQAISDNMLQQQNSVINILDSKTADDDIQLTCHQIEYILLKGIKKNEPYVDQEKQGIDLVISQMEKEKFENNFKQKINLSDNVKLYNVKMKIQQERREFDWCTQEDNQIQQDEQPRQELTQQEKEFLDNNYYVQIQNFQNNRGRAQNVNNLIIECVIDGCDKSFQKCSKLRQHLKCHLSVRFYKCSYPNCGKSFKMPQHLTYHLTTHQKDQNKKYVCQFPGCSSVFRQKWILRDHERTHQNVYKFHCEFPGCNKKYNTRSNLEVHVRKHLGVRPFVCNNCGKQYISKWNMAKHQKRGCTKKQQNMSNNPKQLSQSIEHQNDAEVIEQDNGEIQSSNKQISPEGQASCLTPFIVSHTKKSQDYSQGTKNDKVKQSKENNENNENSEDEEDNSTSEKAEQDNQSISNMQQNQMQNFNSEKMSDIKSQQLASQKIVYLEKRAQDKQELLKTEQKIQNQIDSWIKKRNSKMQEKQSLEIDANQNDQQDEMIQQLKRIKTQEISNERNIILYQPQKMPIYQHLQSLNLKQLILDPKNQIVLNNSNQQLNPQFNNVNIALQYPDEANNHFNASNLGGQIKDQQQTYVLAPNNNLQLVPNEGTKQNQQMIISQENQNQSNQNIQHIQIFQQQSPSPKFALIPNILNKTQHDMNNISSKEITEAKGINQSQIHNQQQDIRNKMDKSKFKIDERIHEVSSEKESVMNIKQKDKDSKNMFQNAKNENQDDTSQSSDQSICQNNFQTFQDDKQIFAHDFAENKQQPQDRLKPAFFNQQSKSEFVTNNKNNELQILKNSVQQQIIYQNQQAQIDNRNQNQQSIFKQLSFEPSALQRQSKSNIEKPIENKLKIKLLNKPDNNLLETDQKAQSSPYQTTSTGQIKQQIFKAEQKINPTVEQTMKMNQKYLDSLSKQQMLCAKLLKYQDDRIQEKDIAQNTDQRIIEKTNKLVIIAQKQLSMHLQDQRNKLKNLNISILNNHKKNSPFLAKDKSLITQNSQKSQMSFEPHLLAPSNYSKYSKYLESSSLCREQVGTGMNKQQHISQTSNLSVYSEQRVSINGQQQKILRIQQQNQHQIIESNAQKPTQNESQSNLRQRIENFKQSVCSQQQAGLVLQQNNQQYTQQQQRIVSRQQSAGAGDVCNQSNGLNGMVQQVNNNKILITNQNIQTQKQLQLTQITNIIPQSNASSEQNNNIIIQQPYQQQNTQQCQILNVNGQNFNQQNNSMQYKVAIIEGEKYLLPEPAGAQQQSNNGVVLQMVEQQNVPRFDGDVQNSIQIYEPQQYQSVQQFQPQSTKQTQPEQINLINIGSLAGQSLAKVKTNPPDNNSSSFIIQQAQLVQPQQQPLHQLQPIQQHQRPQTIQIAATPNQQQPLIKYHEVQPIQVQNVQTINTGSNNMVNTQQVVKLDPSMTLNNAQTSDENNRQLNQTQFANKLFQQAASQPNERLQIPIQNSQPLTQLIIDNDVKEMDLTKENTVKIHAQNIQQNDNNIEQYSNRIHNKYQSFSNNIIQKIKTTMVAPSETSSINNKIHSSAPVHQYANQLDFAQKIKRNNNIGNRNEQCIIQDGQQQQGLQNQQPIANDALKNKHMQSAIQTFILPRQVNSNEHCKVDQVQSMSSNQYHAKNGEQKSNTRNLTPLAHLVSPLGLTGTQQPHQMPILMNSGSTGEQNIGHGNNAVNTGANQKRGDMLRETVRPMSPPLRQNKQIVRIQNNPSNGACGPSGQQRDTQQQSKANLRHFSTQLPTLQQPPARMLQTSDGSVRYLIQNMQGIQASSESQHAKNNSMAGAAGIQILQPMAPPHPSQQEPAASGIVYTTAPIQQLQPLNQQNNIYYEQVNNQQQNVDGQKNQNHQLTVLQQVNQEYLNQQAGSQQHMAPFDTNQNQHHSHNLQ